MRPRPVSVSASLLACAGIALVVAADGSMPWRLARLLLVVSLFALVELVPEARSRRGLQIAVGAAAAATGGTIAYLYLGRAGLSVRSVGAVLACLGGIVLVADGAVARCALPVPGSARPRCRSSLSSATG